MRCGHGQLGDSASTNEAPVERSGSAVVGEYQDLTVEEELVTGSLRQRLAYVIKVKSDLFILHF